MHPVIILLLVLFGLLILVIAGLALSFGLHRFLAPQEKEFDAFVDQQRRIAKIPGVGLVVIREGKTVFEHGYGLADIEKNHPASENTLFTVASVSKTITATALMKLVEAGMIGLDDPINRRLPFTVTHPIFPSREITVRMLVAHTSGITDGPAYVESYTIKAEGVEPDAKTPLGDFLRDYFTPGGKRYDAKANFSQDGPGEKFHYSNVGFGLVGYLVECVSGQPFDCFCREQVFIPLGMPATAWFYRDVDPERVAMPYRYERKTGGFKPTGYYGFPNYPDGSLKTSAHEYARFMSIFINGGKTPEGEPFLKPETVDEMLRIQYPNAGRAVGVAWHKLGELYGHGGGDPGVSTMVEFDPVRKSGQVLFTNVGGDIPIYLRHLIFRSRLKRRVKEKYG